MPCNAIPWRSMRYLKLITLFLISSNSPWFNNHSSPVRTFTPERCATRYTVYVRFFFLGISAMLFKYVYIWKKSKKKEARIKRTYISAPLSHVHPSCGCKVKIHSIHRHTGTQAHNHTQTDILTAGTNRRFNSANETNGMHTPHTKLWQFEWTRRRFRSKR